MNAILWVVLKYGFFFSVGCVAITLAFQILAPIVGFVALLLLPVIIIPHLVLKLVYSIVHKFGFDKKGRIGWLLHVTTFYYKYQEDIDGEILNHEAGRLQDGLPPFSTWDWVKATENLRYIESYKRLVRDGLIDPAAVKREDTRSEPQDDSQNNAKAPGPHDVLGVSANASKDEIRAAYRALMKTNHPDRVAGLDAALQQFANDRTRQIQQAFEQLSGSAS